MQIAVDGEETWAQLMFADAEHVNQAQCASRNTLLLLQRGLAWNQLLFRSRFGGLGQSVSGLLLLTLRQQIQVGISICLYTANPKTPLENSEEICYY